MTYSIQNDYLKAQFKSLGAELCSVVDQNTGFEFIWQAADIWPRHAPNLFPIVGSLLDHEYVYEGRTYSLNHHGFARDLEFDRLHQSEHSICFVLKYSHETLTRYPFKFTLLITYSLEGKRLEQKFRVINEGETKMPFSLGGHPAFNANPIDAYHILFEKEEKVASNRLNGPYISDEEIDVIHGNQIDLDQNIFNNDALIFQGLQSSWVKLENINNGHSVKFDIGNWKYLGIWSKPAANFVCIEPWAGLADYLGHDKQITTKKGIEILQPSSEMAKSFTIKFISP